MDYWAGGAMPQQYGPVGPRTSQYKSSYVNRVASNESTKQRTPIIASQRAWAESRSVYEYFSFRETSAKQLVPSFAKVVESAASTHVST